MSKKNVSPKSDTSTCGSRRTAQLVARQIPPRPSRTPSKRRAKQLKYYLDWWGTRGNAVAVIMGWELIGFDPDFFFCRTDGTSVHLAIDVVAKILELHNQKAS